MSEITRRHFLKRAPAVVAVAAIPTAAVATEIIQKPAETPEQTVDRLAVELHAAMTRLHGEGCEIIRNGYRVVSVIEPHRPRIVEWSGAGHYEVEISDKCRPIYLVERAPEYDSLTEGRCFRLTPRDAKRLGIHYNFENHLRTVLIRKI